MPLAARTPGRSSSSINSAGTAAGVEVVVVELFNPEIEEAAGTLTYDVRVLDTYAEEGLAYLAAQSTGTLPETSGAASLFIDDCPDVSGCLDYPAGARDSRDVGPLPGGDNGGQCYDWGTISRDSRNGWSQQDYDNACNAASSVCNGLCSVELGGLQPRTHTFPGGKTRRCTGFPAGVSSTPCRAARRREMELAIAHRGAPAPSRTLTGNWAPAPPFVPDRARRRTRSVR